MKCGVAVRGCGAGLRRGVAVWGCGEGCGAGCGAARDDACGRWDRLGAARARPPQSHRRHRRLHRNHHTRGPPTWVTAIRDCLPKGTICIWEFSKPRSPWHTLLEGRVQDWRWPPFFQFNSRIQLAPHARRRAVPMTVSERGSSDSRATADSHCDTQGSRNEVKSHGNASAETSFNLGK